MKNLIVLWLLLVGCSSPFEMSERDKVVYRALREFYQHMEEQGVQIAGIGGGLNHDTNQFKEIDLTFDIERAVSLAETRRVLVTTIQQLIAFLNEREEIHVHLFEPPMTIKNVKICIGSSNNHENGIDFAFNCGSRLSYYVRGDIAQELSSKKVHQETYQEALAILAGEKETAQKSLESKLL